MRLGDERESSNVEDSRGAGGGSGGMGGGPGFKVGGIGAVVLVLGALYFGVDPSVVMGMLNGGGAPSQSQTAPRSPSAPAAGGGQHAQADDPQRRFVSQVLASTEDVWTRQFQSMGRTYHAPHLVLFSNGIQSGCGMAQTAIGPFYCPADQKVYLDFGFFRELQDKLAAPGDFARAYVVAHEVGHHVQDELGLMKMVDQKRAGLDEAGRNALSVKVELQADCFAGVWAKQADDTTHILEQGDVEQGLNAAAAVGDDRLQRQARGTVTPDSFTHGSSAQRVRWFRQGLQTGQISQCNTFAD